MYVCAVEQSDDTQTRQMPDENRWRIYIHTEAWRVLLGGERKSETLLIAAKNYQAEHFTVSLLSMNTMQWKYLEFSISWH